MTQITLLVSRLSQSICKVLISNTKVKGLKQPVKAINQVSIKEMIYRRLKGKLSTSRLCRILEVQKTRQRWSLKLGNLICPSQLEVFTEFLSKINQQIHFQTIIIKKKLLRRQIQELYLWLIKRKTTIQ